LQDAGHQVAGLARSDASAQRLEAAGVEVWRGDLGDLDVIKKAAADARYSRLPGRLSRRTRKLPGFGMPSCPRMRNCASES
jgi:hypothetical protein